LILFQEKIEVVNAQAQLFAEADHFDAPTISSKKEALNARYQQLQVKRKQQQQHCLWQVKNLLLPLMNFGSNPAEFKVVETTASCKLFKCYKFVVCRLYYIPFHVL